MLYCAARVQVFNEWLGRMKQRYGYQHIVLINGNHEANAEWQPRVREIFSHATVLRNESVTVQLANQKTLTVFGANFYWPMETPNPYYGSVFFLLSTPLKRC